MLDASLMDTLDVIQKKTKPSYKHYKNSVNNNVYLMFCEFYCESSCEDNCSGSCSGDCSGGCDNGCVAEGEGFCDWTR